MRLSAIDLTCVRGGRDVFTGLSFSVDAGAALAVVGRNGAGKSSLLRIIAGLLAPSRGSIALDGGHTESTLAEQCHFVGHRDALKPALTVLENLRFWRNFLGSARGDDTLLPALQTLGLGHLVDLPAGYLSAGQRRRLALARLLVAPRPLWLLDEPTSALDAAAQTTVTALMNGHLAEGGLIVAATHDPLGISTQPLRIGETT
jgi:heme exporter protein A